MCNPLPFTLFEDLLREASASTISMPSGMDPKADKWRRLATGLALLDTKSKLHQLTAKNICLFLLSLALKVSSELWSLFAAKGAANLVVKAKHIDPVDVRYPPALV